MSTAIESSTAIEKLVRRALQRPDDLVIEFSYRDSKGQTSRRTVSPIRFAGQDRFLGLCLCREQPRQFYLHRCSQPILRNAADVLMPMPMLECAS